MRKQFKNKWDQLKKEYTWWMELLNATGLGWDPQTKTMDADDDWWKIHLEVIYHVLNYLSSCLVFAQNNWTHVSILLLFSDAPRSCKI